MVCAWKVFAASRAHCGSRSNDGQNKSAAKTWPCEFVADWRLANAGLGAVHGFAGPIGGSFPAPHGAICAALLPRVMSTNIRALRQRAPDGEALRRYDEVARVLAGDVPATADDGMEWVRQLVGDLKIPRLGTYGIKSEHIAGLVQKSTQASSMKANPIALTTDELAETLRQAL